MYSIPRCNNILGRHYARIYFLRNTSNCACNLSVQSKNCVQSNSTQVTCIIQYIRHTGYTWCCSNTEQWKQVKYQNKHDSEIHNRTRWDVTSHLSGEYPVILCIKYTNKQLPTYSYFMVINKPDAYLTTYRVLMYIHVFNYTFFSQVMFVSPPQWCNCLTPYLSCIRLRLHTRVHFHYCILKCAIIAVISTTPFLLQSDENYGYHKNQRKTF